MRIQHNIMAMNSYRNLTVNNDSLSKNLEKLSSGYAINRAGDNAAGLAISEKMRMQITGLDVAQDNAQSGINLLQTAEGALTEVHDMLNRMYELAEQSSNGTLAEDDRSEIQKEITQLVEEIDRISETTNFNGINLLDGSAGGSGATASISAAGVEVSLSGAAVTGMSITLAAGTGATASASITTGGAITVNLANGGSTAADIQKAINDAIKSTSGLSDDLKSALSGIKVTADDKVTSAGTANFTGGTAGDGGITFQIGDNGDSQNQLKVQINACGSADLGVDALDLSTRESAIEAMDTIETAIKYVSDVRGTLGANQNRLEHTINNLAVTEENITESESTIRDTDVAEEMMAYTKNNILIQSAQAMLAQANQAPQGVLQLLQ